MSEQRASATTTESPVATGATNRGIEEPTPSLWDRARAASWPVVALGVIAAALIVGVNNFSLRASNEQLTAELLEADNQLALVQQQNERLAEELQQHEAVADQAEDEALHWRAEYERLHGRMEQLQQRVDELEGAHLEWQVRYLALSGRFDEQAEVLAALSRGMLPIPLAPTDFMPDARVSLYVDEARREAIVLGTLQPLPADQSYQLWIWDISGSALSVGLLETDVDGKVLETFQLPALGEGFQQVAITVEPPGGSARPGDEPVALAILSPE